MTASVGGFELVCPLCRTPLDDGDDRYRCRRCPRTYPIVAGIPDLRVRPDRYLTLEEDRAKARALAEHADLGFADLTRRYWEMTPEVPTELADRYVAAALDGERRGGAFLDETGVDVAEASLLEVGCGTGGLLAAAARRGARAVGIDLALRWLVVARRRLTEAGLDVPLVAADGAMPPFRPGTFDVTVSVETLEHTDDQRGLLHWCLASVRPGGTCRVVVANRFSLAPETTVRLWGVGFLPRAWAPAYVRWRRSTRYQFVRPVSVTELRAMLGPRSPAVIGPAPLPPPHPEAGRAELAVRELYRRMARSPMAPLLTRVAPFLEVRT